MPIVVDSSQWTGDDDRGAGGAMVWGEFAERAALDRAAERLQGEGWFRATQAGAASDTQPAAENDQVAPPDEHPQETNRRNLRQNFVGMGTAATSMAAAGIVIATGGAALPAVVAAAAAGGAAMAAGEAAGAAVPETASGGQQDTVRTEGPALGIPAPTDAARQQAQSFLQDSGATRVWVQEAPAT